MDHNAQYQPGMYDNILNDDYHKVGGISKSGLDLISMCPAKYKARYFDGIKEEDKSVFVIGRATHTAVLEPDEFLSLYARKPEDIDRRTKKGKEMWQDFLMENQGKEILSIDNYDMIFGMASSVRQDPIAKQILSRGQAETSVFGTDPGTGLLVKVRPDWIHDDIIVDLKTTRDASPDFFAREVYNRRYFVQAPMYLDVTREFIPKVNTFLFICVEKTPPYLVAVYFLSEETMNIGRDEYRRCMAIYSECVRTGQWPGYGDNRITSVELPMWAIRNIQKAGI